MKFAIMTTSSSMASTYLYWFVARILKYSATFFVVFRELNVVDVRVDVEDKVAEDKIR